MWPWRLSMTRIVIDRSTDGRLVQFQMDATESDGVQLERIRLIFRVFDKLFDFLRLAAKLTVVIFLLSSIVSIVKAVAGTDTAVNIDSDLHFFVTLWSAIDLSCRWAWVVSLVAILFGLLQAKLRRRKTAYLQGRIRELEQRLDSNRSSSGLTPTGDTPKGG